MARYMNTIEFDDRIAAGQDPFWAARIETRSAARKGILIEIEDVLEGNFGDENPYAFDGGAEDYGLRFN